MLKLLVVATVLVSSASAASQCCGPPQYMGALGSLVGQSAVPGQDPLGVNFLQYGAWDYTNRKFGYMIDVVFANGTSSQYGAIQDYAKGTQWLFVDEIKYCMMQKAPLPEPSICIPDDAVFFSSLSIGGNGSDSLLVDSYSKTYNEGTLVGGGSITVRHKDCFPLGSQFMGTSSEMGPPVPTVVSNGWFNITIGIPKPDDWFTVPSYCDQQETNSARRPRHVHSMHLKRFF
ncbi:development-specific protein LVN1.2 isoform X2 [Strongylocentrotus purpuratus]|uniref:Uncharacterized protein n=1 Tax=Strongylocentrotus purpuratus TaxID=7668 RepID=A0A7M7G3K1_STRPU|nr:development-specific protein LVN1.2 isoform X2 [Strongylocentrotus purpuratus]